MKINKALKISIAAGLAFLVSYVVLLLFSSKMIVFPQWYKPYLNIVEGGDLPPCSEYQRRTYVYCNDPKKDLGLEYEEMQGSAEIGLRKISYSGWFLTNENSKEEPQELGVILIHGAGADRRAMLKHASYLNRAGYKVFLIDTHNHGRSFKDGYGIGFGFWESQSLELAMNDLKKNKSIHKFVLFGTSQGAVAALLLASRQNEDIAGIIAENPYYSVKQALKDVPIMGIVPDFVRTQALALVCLVHGVDYFEIDGKVYGPKVLAPVFLIHGGEDRFMPYQHSVNLMTELSHAKTKDIWVMPYGDHEKLWNMNKDEYEKKILNFLEILKL